MLLNVRERWRPSRDFEEAYKDLFAEKGLSFLGSVALLLFSAFACPPSSLSSLALT